MRFQCSPTALSFFIFHWPAMWKSLQLCSPQWSRTVGSAPCMYSRPSWRYVQHLDLFLTSNPSTYSEKHFSLLGSFDHNLISACILSYRSCTCSGASEEALLLMQRRALLHCVQESCVHGHPNTCDKYPIRGRTKPLYMDINCAGERN